MADDKSGAAVLQVDVVAADKSVWQGQATNVIVRTLEGDVGILPGHEPMLAVLVPCAAEIVSADGSREVIALDGGFVSVHDNRVALLSQFATLASDISVTEAERELDALQAKLDAGDATDADMHRLRLATAQLKVVHRNSTVH